MGPISMASVAMASVSAISQQMDAGKAHEQAMKQYGIQQAVNDVDQAIAQASLVGESAKVAQQAKGAELQIEQQEAANVAQAEVNAAAAGVEGTSVDTTQAELEASAGRAQGNLQIQTDNAYNAIDQQSRDVSIGHETAKQLAPTGPNQTAGMINVFNSGLSAYLGAR